MAETRRKFDRDFREGAVRLVRETGKPIAQVARDLGINEGTLGNWVNAERRRRGEGNPPCRTGKCTRRLLEPSRLDNRLCACRTKQSPELTPVLRQFYAETPAHDGYANIVPTRPGSVTEWLALHLRGHRRQTPQQKSLASAYNQRGRWSASRTTDW